MYHKSPQVWVLPLAEGFHSNVLQGFISVPGTVRCLLQLCWIPQYTETNQNPDIFGLLQIFTESLNLSSVFTPSTVRRFGLQILYCNWVGKSTQSRKGKPCLSRAVGLTPNSPPYHRALWWPDTKLPLSTLHLLQESVPQWATKSMQDTWSQKNRSAASWLARDAFLSLLFDHACISPLKEIKDKWESPSSPSVQRWMAIPLQALQGTALQILDRSLQCLATFWEERFKPQIFLFSSLSPQWPVERASYQLKVTDSITGLLTMWLNPFITFDPKWPSKLSKSASDS